MHAICKCTISIFYAFKLFFFLPKGGVFRGGPNEGDDPGLDVREEGVLLGLVEPVHLVQEQDRVPLEQGRLVLGLLYHIPASNFVNVFRLDWEPVLEFLNNLWGLRTE